VTLLTVTAAGYAPPDSTHSRALNHLRSALSRLYDDVQMEIAWNVMDSGRPASDLLEMVEEGEVTLCYFSTSYLVDRVPELAAIDTPFRFPTIETAHRALDGDLGSYLSAQTSAATGLEVLGYWDNGYRHFTNRLRPIYSPNDCTGMRVRVQPSPIHERMVELWGGLPIPTDLRRGIALIASSGVDAQENPLANTVAYGVDQHHRHLSLTAHVYGARGIYVNRQHFDSWDEKLRHAITRAARFAIRWQRAAAAEAEIELTSLLRSRGIEIIDLTDNERAAFAEAVKPLREEIDRRLPSNMLGLPYVSQNGEQRQR
jgi:TRAP-type C4-dicarboxylate transport system substrate-binding protein